MDAMYAAIKKRRSAGMLGDHDMGHQAEHAMDKDADKTKDLHDFVSSLSDHEKTKLKSMLDSGGKAVSDIQKGGPSTQERGKIQQAMEEENQENSMEDADDQADRGPGQSSDDIALSMLDHKSKQENPGKPRNLGDRMKMNLAQKLKSKGKL